MMRPIDRFVAAIRRGEGEELIFQTGAPVRLRQGQNMRVLLAQPVRADQIQAILLDIVPPHVEQGFTADGETSFTVEVQGGPIQVHLRRLQGRIDAVLRAHGTGTPAPTPTTTQPTTTTTTPLTQLQAQPAPRPVAAAPSQPTVAQQVSPPTPLPPAPPESAPAMLNLSSAPAAPPGKRLIDPLLHALVQAKASDLHITSNMQPRMRKDGDIQLLPGFENRMLSSDDIRNMLFEIATPLAKEKFEKTNDADYAYEIPGLARFRVNAFKDRRGVGGVMRVIPSKILSADDLNLPQVIRDMCTLNKGLVLVTGPTGSGKSTTLAAMIDLINKTRTDHLITIEDPVEFVHETKTCLVNQREVHVDTASFTAALKAALREDPDIVLVGEMRDLETIGIAIETAETGHLVFGTLHTNTAVGTVERIIDQFPSDRQGQVRMMLPESLKGVVAQTLLQKKGGGRVAALEILVGSTAVSNLIREGKTLQIT